MEILCPGQTLFLREMNWQFWQEPPVFPSESSIDETFPCLQLYQLLLYPHLSIAHCIVSIYPGPPLLLQGSVLFVRPWLVTQHLSGIPAVSVQYSRRSTEGDTPYRPS